MRAVDLPDAHAYHLRSRVGLLSSAGAMTAMNVLTVVGPNFSVQVPDSDRDKEND